MSCKNHNEGCPSGGSCHHMPGCKDTHCPGHPGRPRGKQAGNGTSVSFIWQSPKFFLRPGLYVKINNKRYRILPAFHL